MNAEKKARGIAPEVREWFAEEDASHDRRKFLTRAGAAVAATLVGSARGEEQEARDWTGESPVRYPDPDVRVLDPRFGKLRLGNAAIQRIYHSPSMYWAEGPAWSGVGRYLLWSDIPNDVQLRWIEDNAQTSVFRRPSGNSNGNTFDYQGRQISCQHGTRKVVRYEPSGEVSVVADRFEGKPFNAPNDVIVHPEDGSIWFTDPGYGSMMNYEGNKGVLHLKEAVYRVDAATGQVMKLTDEIAKPNGLCFSADYQKLYVSDTGAPQEGSAKVIRVWDIKPGGKELSGGRDFASMEWEGKRGGADGIRCDREGNVWASAGWAGAGFDGVHIFAPEDGKRIGAILLPEICSNVCFGGRKRNRLFMTASTSVYALYTEAQGAHVT
ncbi:MAG: SMP-30/gluconolactonase/LRE family protein [Verrucomicrobiota bacterium]